MATISVVLEPDTILADTATDVVLWVRNAGKHICTDIRLSVATPHGMVRLRGDQRILVDRLGPGEQCAAPLRLRAQAAGTFSVPVTNISYRDCYGQDSADDARELPLHVVVPTLVPTPPAPAVVASQPAEDQCSRVAWEGAAHVAARLTKEEIRLVNDALLHAFEEASLRRMLRMQMDLELDQVSGGTSFADRVFSLVQWAERNGQVAALMAAAAAENRGNLELQAAAGQLSGRTI